MEWVPITERGTTEEVQRGKMALADEQSLILSDDSYNEAPVEVQQLFSQYELPNWHKLDISAFLTAFGAAVKEAVDAIETFPDGLEMDREYKQCERQCSDDFLLKRVTKQCPHVAPPAVGATKVGCSLNIVERITGTRSALVTVDLVPAFQPARPPPKKNMPTTLRAAILTRMIVRNPPGWKGFLDKYLKTYR